MPLDDLVMTGRSSMILALRGPAGGAARPANRIRGNGSGRAPYGRLWRMGAVEYAERDDVHIAYGVPDAPADLDARRRTPAEFAAQCQQGWGATG